MRKEFVCRCVDVTKEDIYNSIKMGYRDIESLKRFTGAGTGPCQGKNCLPVLMTILAEVVEKEEEDMVSFTQRPPVHPISFGAVAGVKKVTKGDEK
ncbi:MAG: (2Fe-2S)-binding protein [Candidatus Kariarchaeaceae archaeon]